MTSGIKKTSENHSRLLTILFTSIAIASEKIRLRGVEMPIKRIVLNNPLIYALFTNSDLKLAKPTKEPPIGLSIKAYTRDRQKGKIKKTQKPINPGNTKKKPPLKKPFAFVPLMGVFFINIPFRDPIP
jgi:hypothetical protein